MGTRIVETGTLLLIDGRLALRRDLGGHLALDVDHAPIEMHEKLVKIIGTIVAEGLVDVHGIVAVSTLNPRFNDRYAFENEGRGAHLD